MTSTKPMISVLSCFLPFLVLFTTTLPSVSLAAGYPLHVGYYRSSCPSAEAIVRRVVDKYLSQNPGLGAGLIRLHFHDCFVRGCDASVLLDSTPGNQAEKDSAPNKGSLRGFQVIDAIKAELEAACPHTVSCADILAFAARDSALKLGHISYQVPSGRRDGVVSRGSEALANIPAPFFDLQQLKKSFAAKGLSWEDMVTLSGAHSIGVAHCSSFSNRFNPQDPTMDPGFASMLEAKCPANGPSSKTVALDIETPNRLDNRYYADLRKRRGLLTSDQALMSSSSTALLVKNYASYNKLWAKEFAAAMVRMGQIEVLTGRHGEIRKNCKVINKKRA